MRENSHSIAKEISILHRHFRGYIEHKLMKKHRINVTQFRVLLLLKHKDGISQEQICEEMLLDKSAIARIAKSLEKEGYIIRKINEKDKRAYKLYITDEGKAFYPEMDKLLIDWNEILEECMTQEEMDTMIRLLEKLSGRLQEKKNELKNKKNGQKTEKRDLNG